MRTADGRTAKSAQKGTNGMLDSKYNDLEEIYKEETQGKRIHIPIRTKSSLQKRKEIIKMNTYNLHAPMNKSEFLALPDDLKIEYLTWLESTFRVSTYEISTDMLGYKDGSALGRLKKRLGMKTTHYHKSTRSPEQTLAWHTFINSTSKPKLEPKHETSNKLKVKHLTFLIEGEYNPDELIKRLNAFINPGDKVQITLNICAE